MVVVKVAWLRMPLRIIGKPEDPKLASVPTTGMVPLRGILVFGTTVLFCNHVRENVVAGAVTDADKDSAIDADEDLVSVETILEPEPPLRLNSEELLKTDPWEICKAYLSEL